MYSRVYVEITNICNMRCSFCHGHSRGPRQMTREEFSHILEQLAGHTGYIYYHLMGEPLTHPELPAFLAMAKQRGFRSVITTNGTLLRRHGQALLDAGIHKVSISMHSFESGSDEAFADYLENLAAFAHAAAEAGVDSIDHGAYLDSDALHAMAENGCVWVPTLSTIGNLRGKGRFREEAVQAILKSALENVAAFGAMGGLLAPGTDAGAWAVPHGSETEVPLLRMALGENTDAILEKGTAVIQRKF